MILPLFITQKYNPQKSGLLMFDWQYGIMEQISVWSFMRYIKSIINVMFCSFPIGWKLKPLIICIDRTSVKKPLERRAQACRLCKERPLLDCGYGTSSPTQFVRRKSNCRWIFSYKLKRCSIIKSKWKRFCFGSY